MKRLKEQCKKFGKKSLPFSMKCHERILALKGGRLLVLFVAVAIGLVTSRWLSCAATSVLNWGYLSGTCPVNSVSPTDGCLVCLMSGASASFDWLTVTTIGGFVFLALWWFRTYDVQHQIQQNNFIKGMEKISSDSPLEIEVGVSMLLEVSNATAAFDNEIRVAFIKRLKEFPSNLDGKQISAVVSNRLSYAQYILRWFIDHLERGGRPLNLNGMDCRYQEFLVTSNGKKLALGKLFPRREKPDPGISFEWANCASVDFSGVELSNFDLTNAENAQLRGAYMKDRPLPKGVALNEAQATGILANIGDDGKIIRDIEIHVGSPISAGEVQAVQESRHYSDPVGPGM